ncbi:MAG: hypothetical protein JO368_09965 [Acidimicrobiales bacterium]|nr:hypothetical protein [Acidimicrobiales bacterium]
MARDLARIHRKGSAGRASPFRKLTGCLLLALSTIGLSLVVASPAGALPMGTITTEVPGLNGPHGVVYDATDNSVYVSVTNACQVLQDDLTTSTVSVLVNTAAVCGAPSAAGTAATLATLDHPLGLAIDEATQTLYIADKDNHGIEVVNLTATPPDMGTFIPLVPGAPVSEPDGISIDQGTGTLYVADSGTDVVWSIPSGGSPSIFAGVFQTPGFNGNGISATSAKLDLPSSVDFESGVVYISDTDNNEIRSVTFGIIQDVIGSPVATAGCSPDGSPATNPITAPTAFQLDGAGTQFYDETGCELVREIGGTLTMQTVAGGGATPYPYSGDQATNVTLNGPHGLTFVPDGTNADLWFSDSGNGAVNAVTAVASGAEFSPAPRFTSANMATAFVGQPFTYLVTTTGFPIGTKLIKAGKLPKGLKLTDNKNGTATIAGTTKGTGTFCFVVRAKPPKKGGTGGSGGFCLVSTTG